MCQPKGRVSRSPPATWPGKAASSLRTPSSTHSSIYDRYLRYQIVAGLYRGEVASGKHRSLLEHALKRDWKAAQKALTKHVQDCVDHIIGAGLLDRAPVAS